MCKVCPSPNFWDVLHTSTHCQLGTFICPSPLIVNTVLIGKFQEVFLPIYARVTRTQSLQLEVEETALRHSFSMESNKTLI